MGIFRYPQKKKRVMVLKILSMGATFRVCADTFSVRESYVEKGLFRKPGWLVRGESLW
jgi:hypothetical protein